LLVAGPLGGRCNPALVALWNPVQQAESSVDGAAPPTTESEGSNRAHALMNSCPIRAVVKEIKELAPREIRVLDKEEMRLERERLEGELRGAGR
jgi:hypothetical protein